MESQPAWAIKVSKKNLMKKDCKFLLDKKRAEGMGRKRAGSTSCEKSLVGRGKGKRAASLAGEWFGKKKGSNGAPEGEHSSVEEKVKPFEAPCAYEEKDIQKKKKRPHSENVRPKETPRQPRDLKTEAVYLRGLHRRANKNSVGGGAKRLICPGFAPLREETKIETGPKRGRWGVPRRLKKNIYRTGGTQRY